MVEFYSVLQEEGHYPPVYLELRTFAGSSGFVWLADPITEERKHAFINDHATGRNKPVSSMDYFAGVMDNLMKREAEVNFNWSARQAYIAFGVGIAAAAEHEVDATPMEGFGGPALDKLLGLDQLGLRSVTNLALGYRDAENDWLAPLAMIRREKERLIVRK